MINAERLASAPAEEIIAEMISVRREIDGRELYFSQLAAAFAQTRYWDQVGDNSATDWIRLNCHMTSPAAAVRIAVGEQLGRMPESVQAMHAGEIGFAHISVMARTADAVGKAFDEKPLLAKARDCSAGKFYYKAQHYRHALQPKAYAEEQAEQAQKNEVRLSTAEDGSLLISGILDPVNGAAVRGALEPLARASGQHDYREPEQRMADALVEIITHGGKHEVQLQVTSSVETLLGLIGAPGADMEFSLPISSKTVERWACDCSVTRILMQDLPHLWGSPGRSPGMGPTTNSSIAGGPERSPAGAEHEFCFGPSGAAPPPGFAGHLPMHGEDSNWQIARTDDGRIVPIAPLVTFGLPRGPD
jgi:hypothetical protein